MRYLSLILFAMLLAPFAAQAQDIAGGERVARQRCTGCHEIGERPKAPFGFAPSFAKIARMKGMTQTSIEVFLGTPHEVMPNYTLSSKEIRDVAAYIASLREPSRT